VIAISVEQYFKASYWQLPVLSGKLSYDNNVLMYSSDLMEEYSRKVHIVMRVCWRHIWLKLHHVVTICF